MFDERTNLSQQVRDNLRNFFKDKLFTTTIPRNIRLAEAPSHGKPVMVYDPKSKGAEAYQELAAELLKRHGVATKKQAKKLILDEIPPVPDRPIISTPKSRKVWPFGRDADK
jgi:chromosome partitioning protein